MIILIVPAKLLLAYKIELTKLLAKHVSQGCHWFCRTFVGPRNDINLNNYKAILSSVQTAFNCIILHWSDPMPQRSSAYTAPELLMINNKQRLHLRTSNVK